MNCVWMRCAAGALLAVVAGLSGCAGGSSSSGTKQTQPPLAIISAPSSGAVGADITFSAAGSSDPQGQTLAYAWSFGDGITASGVTVAHVYTKSGAYTVTLTVTDTSGASANSSTPLAIAFPPVANAGGPYSGYVGTPLTFNGSASTDPQGLALTYVWSFGDNSTGSGVSPTHTYTSTNTYNLSPGAFTVKLVTTNSAGISSSAVSTTATISLPPPVITINGPYTGKPTLAISFTSKIVEPYDSTFTYLWSFGDGGMSNVANPIHTYAATGTYNVSLTVTGQYNETATVTSTASIIAQGTGPAQTGVVKSGSTPAVGARVYLLAANTTGYGQPAVSLLSGTGQSDTIGSYVLSGADGSFTLPTGYACGTHTQVYIYAAGGSVGSNSNSSATMMAALGGCGYLSAGGSVTVNEATTIAAAYGLSGYATDGLHVSSPNTTAALTGIANAFLNAANLVSPASGNALTATPTGGVTPQTTVNTLADILNGCVSSATGSNVCLSLFSAAPSGSTTPANTADAAINIAHNQGANASGLYTLLQAAKPFAPVLTGAPHDWTLGVTYGGLQGYGTQGLTVDGAGNVWVLQYPTAYGSYPYLTEFSSNGVILQSENTTCLNGTEAIPGSIVADLAGNIWLLNTSGATYLDINGNEQSYYTAQYCTLSNAGVMISPPGGYNLGGSETTVAPALYSMAIDGSGNGLIPASTLLKRTVTGGSLNGGGYVVGNAPYVAAVAVDAGGNFWVSSPGTNGIVKLSSTGALLSPANGYTAGGLSMPASVAIDHTGNVWAINSLYGYLNSGFSVSELSSSGTAISPSAGFTNSLMPAPYSIAIDGAGYAWVATGYDVSNPISISAVELAPNGSVAMSIAHPNELREYLDGPQSLAVDSTGSVWVSNGLAYNVTQFVGVATPVVTPLAANLAAPYSAPASRP